MKARNIIMRVFLAINLYNCTGVFGVLVEARFIRIIPEREISSAGMKLKGGDEYQKDIFSR